MFVNVIQKLKAIIPYSMPIKVVVGFILTALGSASVLGLLSEFAVYNYALVNGFRVPVEGIPYLRPTVTIISLALLIGSVFCFFITYLFTKTTAQILYAPSEVLQLIIAHFNTQQNTKPEISLINNMRKLGIKKVLLISSATSVFLTVILSWVLNHDTWISLSLLKIIQDTYELKFLDVTYKKIILFVILFIMYLSVFRPKYAKYIAMSVAGLSIIGMLFFMFNEQLYSKFLYSTGFGGERQIELYTKIDGEKISGKLLIQSNDYYILLLPEKHIVEYPVKTIVKVKYMQVPNVFGLN